MNLLESYKGRLAYSDKAYAAQHNGKRMPMKEKMLTAAMLSNTANFLNEAFTNQVGTQRADMGKFKQFCMDITTLVMPNLIVNDIFMVKEMSSRVGWLTYMSYSLGTAKGAVGGLAEQDPYTAAIKGYEGRRDGTAYENNWNTPINDYRVGFGEVSEARVNYTGNKIVETVAEGTTAADWVFAWLPVTKYEFIDADGQVVAVTNGEQGIDPKTGKFLAADVAFEGTPVKVRYTYDNEYIPAAQLPTVVAHMEGIALNAKIRRIGVYYDMLASYQAKQDYGMDLESQIAQQAQAELQFEIDNQAVMMLKAGVYGAKDAMGEAVLPAQQLEWLDQNPQAVSYSMRAESFAKTLEDAKMAVYKRTNRWVPNYMIISPEVLPIMNFVPGFKAADYSVANGPFLAGTISNMKVFVSPALTVLPGETPVKAHEGAEYVGLCILGVLSPDGKTATGVYAPYMPIVPTQLLQFADGANSQGFATMYDMQFLNSALLASISVFKSDEVIKAEVING